MRRHDKRTREQRKADESALFAAACLGATILLIAISILATNAQAVDAEPEKAPIADEYDPAWDIPATESAVCNDVFLGEFTLTAYCPGRCCCGKWASGYTATGTLATEGRTIAVDPKVIPYGTRVLLIWPDGTQREYIAEDCGGGVNGNRIDVFFGDHQAARVFGGGTMMHCDSCGADFEHPAIYRERENLDGERGYYLHETLVCPFCGEEWIEEVKDNG